MDALGKLLDHDVSLESLFHGVACQEDVHMSWEECILACFHEEGIFAGFEDDASPAASKSALSQEISKPAMVMSPVLPTSSSTPVREIPLLSVGEYTYVGKHMFPAMLTADNAEDSPVIVESDGSPNCGGVTTPKASRSRYTIAHCGMPFDGCQKPSPLPQLHTIVMPMRSSSADPTPAGTPLRGFRSDAMGDVQPTAASPLSGQVPRFIRTELPNGQAVQMVRSIYTRAPVATGSVSVKQTLGGAGAATMLRMPGMKGSVTLVQTNVKEPVRLADTSAVQASQSPVTKVTLARAPSAQAATRAQSPVVRGSAAFAQATTVKGPVNSAEVPRMKSSAMVAFAPTTRSSFTLVPASSVDLAASHRSPAGVCRDPGGAAGGACVQIAVAVPSCAPWAQAEDKSTGKVLSAAWCQSPEAAHAQQAAAPAVAAGDNGAVQAETPAHVAWAPKVESPPGGQAAPADSGAAQPAGSGSTAAPRLQPKPQVQAHSPQRRAVNQPCSPLGHALAPPARSQAQQNTWTAEPEQSAPSIRQTEDLRRTATSVAETVVRWCEDLLFADDATDAPSEGDSDEGRRNAYREPWLHGSVVGGCYPPFAAPWHNELGFPQPLLGNAAYLGAMSSGPMFAPPMYSPGSHLMSPGPGLHMGGNDAHFNSMLGHASPMLPGRGNDMHFGAHPLMQPSRTPAASMSLPPGPFLAPLGGLPPHDASQWGPTLNSPSMVWGRAPHSMGTC